LFSPWNDLKKIIATNVFFSSQLRVIKAELSRDINRIFYRKTVRIVREKVAIIF